MAARSIAGHLFKVIHLVVDCDQTCGVPGRFIGENVAVLRDIVDFANCSNSPVALLSLDLIKRKRLLVWSAPSCVTPFSKWVLAPSLSNGSTFSIVASRVQLILTAICPLFSLSCGVCQGCPLSPLLYVLVAEVLACNICANPRIVGVTLPGSSVLLPVISQYVEDTSLVLTTNDSIKATFETFSLFESGSGAKFNQLKSKGLWLGSWMGWSDPPIALDWSTTTTFIYTFFYYEHYILN